MNFRVVRDSATLYTAVQCLGTGSIVCVPNSLFVLHVYAISSDFGFTETGEDETGLISCFIYLKVQSQIQKNTKAAGRKRQLTGCAPQPRGKRSFHPLSWRSLSCNTNNYIKNYVSVTFFF